MRWKPRTTGYGQAEDRRLSQVAGFDAHLVKPVELADVEALVAARAARHDEGETRESTENISR